MKIRFIVDRDCKYFEGLPMPMEEWEKIPNPNKFIEDIVMQYAEAQWNIDRNNYQKPPKRYRQFDYDYKKVAIINGTYGGKSKTDWFFDNKIRCVIYSFSYGDLAVDYIDPYTNRGVFHLGLRQHIFKP